MSWKQWLRNEPRPGREHGGSGLGSNSFDARPEILTVLIAGENTEVVTRLEQILSNELPATARVQTTTLGRATDGVVQELPQRIVLVMDPEDARCLNTLRELRDLGIEHILAVGPSDQANLILSAIQQGAYQYLGIDQIDSELTRLLKQGSPAASVSRKNVGKVISVVGAQGGCGTSTCVTNLALAMAQKYQPIGLIDLDLQRGDVMALLDLETHHTIADLCRNASRLDRAMFDQCFARHEGGVMALAAPSGFDHASAVTPVGIRKILNMARMVFPFTFIDMPHNGTEAERQALLQSDNVLVVTILDFTALRHARRLLGYLQAIGVADDRVHLVINRGNRPQEMTTQDAKRILQRDARFWIPEDAKNVNHANNHGTPLVVVAPRTRAAKAISEMAYQLNGKSGSAR